ncbi:MAG: efflux RND transporter periplasmic adaptor subunit [Phycisphaerae bacterium]|nr:efflux RND transporter periplasmic adaptor subunit [Phycisphaerae bacterium]
MKIRAALVIGAVFGGWILGLVTGHVWFLPIDDKASVASMDSIAGEDHNSVADEDSGIIQLNAEQIREFGIEIDTAGPTKLQTALQLPGRIVLNADKVASIVPRVSGVAVKVGKTQGDGVVEDEVMAVIDSRELADVKTDYLTAIERVTLSQATFDREVKLWKERVSSQQDYVDAKQTLAEAKIAQFNAEQKLHALGFTEDDSVKLKTQSNATFTHYEVCAPFEGTVIEKKIALGEPVFDTSQMFRIADLRTVWVEFGVHEEELGAIHVGKSIVIKAMGTDSRTQSIVDYISPMVSESTRMATIRVVLDNPSLTRSIL